MSKYGDSLYVSEDTKFKFFLCWQWPTGGYSTASQLNCFFCCLLKSYIHGSSMLCCGRLVLPTGEYQIVPAVKEASKKPYLVLHQALLHYHFWVLLVVLSAVHQYTKTSRTHKFVGLFLIFALQLILYLVVALGSVRIHTMRWLQQAKKKK